MAANETDVGTAGAKTQAAAAEAPTITLDDVISVTPLTGPDRARDLVKEAVEQALKGVVKFDRNLTVTFNRAIEQIDQQISRQLAAIMHHEKFQKLEGTWRGLNYLVMNSETGTTLKIRVLNLTKRELFKDLSKATEFDQSETFKRIYEQEFGSPGGAPYGALIGDYEFSDHPEDIDLLGDMSHVAAASFSPFISAAAPRLLGLTSYTELSKPRDLAQTYDSDEYAKWKSFRESEDSRFVVLTMPRTLSRLPYGEMTKPVEEFGYEEAEFDSEGRPKPMAHDHYCWMNSAYVLGTTLTGAFSRWGFCVAIRGVEGGGKIENLPSHIFYSDDGDVDQKCPTEIGITDRREAELGRIGFYPLSHFKNTDYAAFIGGQTVQKPKIYDRPEATANAAISARLPYIMATSRFAHYLKVMARDKIGSFMEVSDCEAWLNRWISNYVNSNPDASPEMKAQFPLAAAQVKVSEIPGAPGSYNAVAYLRPWLQLEELTTSMRLVARIPQVG